METYQHILRFLNQSCIYVIPFGPGVFLASLCSMLARKAIVVNKSLSQEMLCFNIFGRANGERELWVFSLKKVVLSVVPVVLLSHGVNPTQS